MSGKTSLIGTTVFLIIMVCVTISYVNAHTPQAMSLSYNSNTEDLSVTITHNVVDNTSHYIKTVVVKVNGSTVLTQPYTSQPTKGTFTYIYANITANKGATIQVTATCSIAGSITRTLTVDEGTSTTNGGNDHDIPGYYGILIVVGISLFIGFRALKKKIKGA